MIIEFLNGEEREFESLRGADLTGAKLRNAILYDTDLYGANLTNADLTRANLTRANLTRANLRNADLTNADLYSANLYGADLTNADLTNADLRSADLRNAKLDFQIVCLQSSKYDIVLYDWHNLKIGCQLHALDEWLERGELIAVKCGETDHYKAEIKPIIRMFETLRGQRGE